MSEPILRFVSTPALIAGGGDYAIIDTLVAMGCPFCLERALGDGVTHRNPLTAGVIKCAGGHRFTAVDGKVKQL